ncbi:MAG TPA: histidine phosphatase family protein [Gaiellaceae bacterium]|nr:histidine phosphatase family protein [Gaiellaceae bacterium]
MTTLLLARHGQTDWNLERRWQGHADRPLNLLGREQAAALGASLTAAGLGAIHTSDLLRARQTAEIVAELLHLPVEIDARLREVDVGEWSGLTTPEIERLYPAGNDRRLAGGTGWDRGESYEALGARVVEALMAISAARPDGKALVVTHGGPIRAAWLETGGSLAAWNGSGNCDVDEIRVEDGRMRWIHSSRGGLHEQVQG